MRVGVQYYPLDKALDPRLPTATVLSTCTWACSDRFMRCLLLVEESDAPVEDVKTGRGDEPRDEGVRADGALLLLLCLGLGMRCPGRCPPLLHLPKTHTHRVTRPRLRPACDGARVP